MNYEVKADALSAAFDKAKLSGGAAARPNLAGGLASGPARTAFVDGYLRRGNEVELKSFTGAVAADGGYAIPKEIDAEIDAALKSISPRATGGPVSPGRPYRVGENGPELFVPTTSGRIETGGGGRGSASLNLTINVSDNGRGSAPEALQRSSRHVARAARQALARAGG